MKIVKLNNDFLIKINKEYEGILQNLSENIKNIVVEYNITEEVIMLQGVIL